MAPPLRSARDATATRVPRRVVIYGTLRCTRRVMCCPTMFSAVRPCRARRPQHTKVRTQWNPRFC
eukprot:3467189-Amphidinium_carterae.1